MFKQKVTLFCLSINGVKLWKGLSNKLWNDESLFIQKVEKGFIW